MMMLLLLHQDREATQTGCVKTKPAKPHTVRERETLVCIRKTTTRHKRGERNHHLVRTSERDVGLYLSLSVSVWGRETLVETDLFERREGLGTMMMMWERKVLMRDEGP